MAMLIILKLLGSIALLIYGMKVMSEALQKMAGPQNILRHGIFDAKVVLRELLEEAGISENTKTNLLCPMNMFLPIL